MPALSAWPRLALRRADGLRTVNAALFHTKELTRMSEEAVKEALAEQLLRQRALGLNRRGSKNRLEGPSATAHGLQPALERAWNSRSGHSAP